MRNGVFEVVWRDGAPASRIERSTFHRGVRAATTPVLVRNVPEHNRSRSVLNSEWSSLEVA